SQNLVLNPNQDIIKASQTWTVNTGQTLTVQGNLQIVSGTLGISGGGKVIFACTASGGANAITVNSGATLQINNNNSRQGNPPLTINSGAVVDINGQTLNGNTAWTFNGTGIITNGCVINSSVSAATIGGSGGCS